MFLKGSQHLYIKVQGVQWIFRRNPISKITLQQSTSAVSLESHWKATGIHVVVNCSRSKGRELEVQQSPVQMNGEELSWRAEQLIMDAWVSLKETAINQNVIVFSSAIRCMFPLYPQVNPTEHDGSCLSVNMHRRTSLYPVYFPPLPCAQILVWPSCCVGTVLFPSPTVCFQELIDVSLRKWLEGGFAIELDNKNPMPPPPFVY